jgi:tetratricopeptide (TPR) repeat protein
MKKKSLPGTKNPPVKAKSKQAVTPKAGRVLQMNGKSPAPRRSAEETAVVQAYQDGLRALQERKFERAKTLFQKAASSEMREIADRANVHLNTCAQHLQQAATAFRTPEEHYDYAVSLINVGDYVAAREHLEKILKQTAKVDYAWYGMAVLDCLTSHFEDALRELGEAITLNPANRYQARNDSDFNNLADDPRFTELLYPESDVLSLTPSEARR